MRISSILGMAREALAREKETVLGEMHARVWMKAQGSFRSRLKKCFEGPVFGSMRFLAFLCRKASFRYTDPAESEILFFAGTKNQMDSLLPAVSAAIRRGMVLTVCVEEAALPSARLLGHACVRVRFDPRLLSKSVALYVLRARGLLRDIRSEYSNPGFERCFYVFCLIYAYLPYFFDLLAKSKPGFVILANDHSVANCCIRLAADTLGVRTVYLQHACVSESFPALNFDYAFLDGLDALEKYGESEKTGGFGGLVFSGKRERQVFLAGQQKRITVSRPASGGFVVGIGTSDLDDFDVLETFLRAISRRGVKVIVRTHPGQPIAFIERLLAYRGENPLVEHCDSNSVGLIPFFESCSVLVAGNTSLHLEAALAGLRTYYIEFKREESLPDYYGFVRSGLSAYWPEGFAEMSDTDLKGLAAVYEERQRLLRRYSESFGTRWQGREGELVMETLERIRNGRDFSDLFQGTEDRGCFQRVYRLVA